MSSSKQALTTPIDPGYTSAVAGMKGHRDEDSLRAAFPEAVIFPAAAPAYTDGGALGIGITALNGGDAAIPSFVTDLGVTGGQINDVGYMFSSFNLNYKGSSDDLVPVMSEVVVGGGGLPASSYVPNLASVGVGNLASPSMQPEFPAEHLPSAGTEVGSGLSATSDDMSPHNSSNQIARNTIGGYIKGKSWPPAG